VHGLGATDSYIAGRFARRATGLAGAGGLLGAVASVPVLLALATLTTPFVTAAPEGTTPQAAADMAWLLAASLRALPLELSVGLPALPVVAALLGYATAQTTVRRWLRRMP